MTVGRPTICCSAVALIAAFCAALSGAASLAPSRSTFDAAQVDPELVEGSLELQVPQPTGVPVPAPQAPATGTSPPIDSGSPALPGLPAPPPAILPFKPKWTKSLSGWPTALPAFAGPVGFFPLEENRLVAYDLTDGGERWSVPRTIDLQPAIGDGLVFVADRSTLAALRERDGSIAWQRTFSEKLAVPLVWDNGWLVAATASGAILAFRGTDGAIIWRRELGAAASARPALASDRVYVPAGDGSIVALRIEDGAPVWQRRIGGVPNEMLALDDRVYVGSNDNYLYCLRADRGMIDWRWPTGADVIGRPVADDQLVYFVSLDNVLRALDRRTGNQRWKRTLPLRPRTGPVRFEDTLIVSGVAPSLRIYAMKDGVAKGDATTEGELAAPPYVLPDAEMPTLVVVTRHVEKGTILTSLTREPPPAPQPDPNPDANPPAAPKPEPPSLP